MSDKLEKFKKIFEVMNEEFVSQVDIAKVLKVLTDLMRDFRASIDEKVAKNKADISEIALSKAELTKKELTAKVSKLEADLRSDIRTTTRMFEQNVNDLRDELPEEYEDSEFKQELSRIEKLIPKNYDDTKLKEEIEELEDKVEKLEKEIEELKKRPIGTGGGVTNMRIQQAFKYILKTEEPVGLINGVNLTYTLSQPIFAILSMSLNGETIAQLPNYTINGNTFTFSTALPSAYSGKDFEAKYI